MTKLNGQLIAHVTDETEEQFKQIAHMTGLSPSVYLRNMILDHVATKKAEFQSMQKIFNSQSSFEPMSTQSTQNSEASDPPAFMRVDAGGAVVH